MKAILLMEKSTDTVYIIFLTAFVTKAIIKMAKGQERELYIIVTVQ